MMDHEVDTKDYRVTAIRSQDPEFIAEIADESEVVGDALIKRGEELLILGRRLLAQAVGLNAAAAGLEVSQETRADVERSVGRKGEVNIGSAIDVAKELGVFTRKEFQEATGLNQGQAMKWLQKLVNNKPQIIEPVVRGSGRGRPGMYQYIPIEGKGPTQRPEHARGVEASAGVGMDSTARSSEVPYTGRPIGSSGKPGRDKKISKQRRVKRKSGQIIGGR